jgi:glycosyltransferase involved in cell wall biosynthesis
MKILHLVTSLDFGGLERRIEILSKYPSNNNEMIFVALGGGGATFNKLLENKSQTILLEQDFSKRRISTLLAIIKLLHKIRPDVIHCHGAEGNLYGVLAAKIVRVPLIIAEEIGIPSLSRLSALAFRFIYKLSDSIICMSPTVKAFLNERGMASNDKLKLVYNPVLTSDTQRTHDELRDENNIIKFVYLGRLEEVKNPDGLLQAFKGLVESGFMAHLTIFGAGSLSRKLENYIAINALEEHVLLSGFAEQPLTDLLNYNILVQPSHTEGFSLALAEAMSCGLPALCTPCGSALELIEDGKSGWITKDSSSQAILVGLKRVFEDRNQINYMASESSRIVTLNHSPTNYAKKLDDFYNSIFVGEK